MTKIAGSGSISQKHGYEDPDPDPPQNVLDPEHWNKLYKDEAMKGTNLIDIKLWRSIHMFHQLFVIPLKKNPLLLNYLKQQ